MKRRMAVIAAMICLLALSAPLAASAAGSVPTVSSGPRAVVVVLAPYMTWDDIVSGPVPSIRGLAQSGTLANVNLRSGSVSTGTAAIVKGALLVSAGAGVTVDPTSLGAYSSNEILEGGVATSVYSRLSGVSSGRDQVLYLGVPRQVFANRDLSTPGAVGSLGQAVRDAGGATVGVGNSDPGLGIVDAARVRPAGMMAMDGEGRTMFGDVSAATLDDDATRPFGVRSDVAKLLAAYTKAMSSATVASRSGAVLAVIDPGDLSRVAAAASDASTEVVAAQHATALRELDKVVSRVSAALGPQDTIMVLSLAAPEVEGEPPALVPAVLKGPGLTGGVAEAASTHRPGIVTFMDLSVSALTALGAKVPATMGGSTIGSTAAGTTLAERVATLDRYNRTSVAVEVVRLPVINIYISLVVALMVVCAFLVMRGVGTVTGRWGRSMRALLPLSLAVPLASTVGYLFWPWPATGEAVTLLLVGVSLLLWAGVMLIARGDRIGAPIALFGLGTTAIVLVDQWVGAPLSQTGLFSYSPLFGARYYGMGNESAALILGASIIGAGVLLDALRDQPWIGAAKKWGVPVLGALMVVTAAAPMFGANVGVAVWGTVGYGVFWALVNGKKVLSWKTALVVLVLVVVLIAALSAIDLLGNPGQETHLGKALQSAGTGGVGTLWTIFARKADTNLRVLTRTNWTYLLVGIMGTLIYLRWKPRGEFKAMLERWPGYSAGLTASLVAGTVAYFTEDSGIIIPALIILYVGVGALYLIMTRMATEGPAPADDAPARDERLAARS
jgi:hypothetical protein